VTHMGLDAPGGGVAAGCPLGASPGEKPWPIVRAVPRHRRTPNCWTAATRPSVGTTELQEGMRVHGLSPTGHGSHACPAQRIHRTGAYQRGVTASSHSIAAQPHLGAGVRRLLTFEYASRLT
jgi:hypothetical protein